MGYTEKLASFLVKQNYSHIPREAMEAIKPAILDCIGVAFAGAEADAGRLITEYVSEMAAKPEAGVIVKGFKTTASMAALVNGTMAHALDYDDYDCIYGFGHSTVVLLPALLALAEKYKLSGKKVLEGYAIGFEGGSKVGHALQAGGLSHLRVGWHPMGCVGTIGATIAAAKMLDLDIHKMRCAIGMGASLASGLRKNFGTMTKPFHAGRTASNGVTAALLAQKGFTASEDVLDEPLGFCKIYGPEGDISKIDGLGEPWELLACGITIKKYPCCAANHWHLDALFDILKNNRFDAGDVAEVVCRTSLALIPVELIYHRPKTELEAKFSMEYNMAVAILDRKVGLEQFTEERANRPDVQDLLKKVKWELPEDGKLDEGMMAIRWPSRVTVKLRDGRELSQGFQIVKGDPRNPLSTEELMAKFKDCIRNKLSAQNIERCADMILHLEKVEDISKLMDILTFNKMTA